MSDQPENFAAQPAPAQAPEMEERDLASLFDEVAPEDFGEAMQEPSRQEPPTPPQEAPRRQSFTGYQPNIEAKRRELAELRQKMAGFRTTDTYVIDDGQGNRQFDFAALQADQVMADGLRDEIDDLKERARERKDAGRQQQDTALQLARSVLNEKLGRSRMPQDMKDKVVRMYRSGFDALTQQGWWGRPEFGDRTQLRAAIGQLLDTVIGRVAQERYTSTQETADAPGMDASHGGDAPKPQASDEEEDDEVTKAIMEAHARRTSGGRKTIGQIRREQREAAMKGRE